MSPSASSGLAALAAVPFRDSPRAVLNYERIAAIAPAAILDPLPNLLAETPDPDAALNGFERLVEAADQPLLRTLQQHPTLIYYALTVFAYSHFLGDTLLQNPDLFSALLREHGFQRAHRADEFREALARHRSRTADADVSASLAGFKRRELIRIMLRDVLGIATLTETTAEISALADVLIAESLREAQSLLRNRYGAPRLCDSAGRWIEPAVAVLSLGKLGGAELNYSSDVDLLFLYQDEGAPDAGASISNREYFIRLAQLVTDLLSRSTREGPVFRIDLRLRPQGREGEPAVGLRHALHYYAQTAHDWEIQAMIKARHSAGDAALSRLFLRGVEPFVYRREVNFAAIETALHSLQKISHHHRSATIDVKNDSGGIRDIEFLAQCLQRVYGGPERWLRAAGTLVSLHKLHDKGHLSGKTYHELSTAYEFLRRVEHRLQLRQGQQTHRLPQSREQLEILWRLLGGGKSSTAHATGATVAEPDDPAAEMVHALRRHMTAVAEIYNRIVHQQQVRQERSAAAPSTADAGEFHLQPPPFDPGSEPAFQQMLTRLAADAPELYDIASRRDLGAIARRNLHRFLSAAFTTSERYAVVARHPAALDRALALFEASEFLTDILVRHPEEIETLDAAATAAETDAALFPGSSVAPAPLDSDALLEYIVTAGLSQNEKMAALRRHYRHRIFVTGARDVLAQRPVLLSLSEASAAAVAAIRAAFIIAEAPPALAVLGLGRLGSAEFDVGSDADLLFVCGDDSDHAAATRAAERITHVLAAYTREGAVFSVDARLRPRGLEGELVITSGHLAHYFASEAQPWEALSYTKLRPLVGAHDVAFQAIGAVLRSLPRFAADPAFPAALRAMRLRLEQSGQSLGEALSGEPSVADASRNFKLGPGGFYDVDFIASYLLVRAACDPAQTGDASAASADLTSFFPRPHILDSLATLAARSLLSPEDHQTLASAAELLRTTEHVVRLVVGRARKSLPTASHARATTERLTAAILRRQFPAGLETELRSSAARVREIFDRTFS